MSKVAGLSARVELRSCALATFPSLIARSPMNIDSPRGKFYLLTASSLATVAAALSGCDRVRTATAAPRETAVPTVTVVRARKMDVPIIRFPNGTTRALNQVTIRARVKGFLKEVHFTEGSNVKKDQLLLVIEEEPFKVKVAQAKAVLEEAEAALKKAKESRAKEVAKAGSPSTRPSFSSIGWRSAGNVTW